MNETRLTLIINSNLSFFSTPINFLSQNTPPLKCAQREGGERGGGCFSLHLCSFMHIYLNENALNLAAAVAFYLNSH